MEILVEKFVENIRKSKTLEFINLKLWDIFIS